MTKEDIYKYIRDLSRSQGYYGRLLNAIEEDESILIHLEEQGFSDPVDMILYLEC